MKFEFWVTGASTASFIREGTEFYLKRIRNYHPLEFIEIKTPKGRNPEFLPELESEIILRKIKPADYLILLDERGETYTSLHFAEYLNKLMNTSYQRVVFLSGGPYGFSDELKSKARQMLAISAMTTTHELCRLFFLEQFYRAMTLLNHHPYHH